MMDPRVQNPFDAIVAEAKHSGWDVLATTIDNGASIKGTRGAESFSAKFMVARNGSFRQTVTVVDTAGNSLRLTNPQALVNYLA